MQNWGHVWYSWVWFCILWSYTFSTLYVPCTENSSGSIKSVQFSILYPEASCFNKFAIWKGLFAHINWICQFWEMYIPSVFRKGHSSPNLRKVSPHLHRAPSFLHHRNYGCNLQKTVKCCAQKVFEIRFSATKYKMWKKSSETNNNLTC